MSLSRDDYRSRILEDFLEDVLGYKDGTNLAEAYEEAHEHFSNTDPLMLSDYRLATTTQLDMAITYGYICKPARVLSASEYQDVPIITALAPHRQEFLQELLNYARARSNRDPRYQSLYYEDFREFFDYFKNMVGEHQKAFQPVEVSEDTEADIDDDRCESDYADEYVRQDA